MRQNLMLWGICLSLCPLFACDNSNPSQSINAAPQGNIASASPTPKKDTEHFVNPCKYSPCVKFSFDYPVGWVFRPEFTANMSDDSKYASVPSDTSGMYNIGEFPEDKFDSINIRENQNLKTIEDAKDAADLASAGNAPEYKRVSKGEVRVGSYDGYQITWTHPKAGVSRIIYIPQPSGGLEITIHDAPGAPEMKGVDDPSKMGRYSLILNSLKIGSE
jgi:hypothetical protein